MSIFSYLSPLGNGNTGTGDLLYGEYVLKLGARRKDGKIVMRQVEFGMSGPATGNLTELDEAASQKGEQIAALSEGVIFGFYKKMGKYKNDEQPSDLACKATQWGSVIMSNDPRVENEDAIGPYPLQQKSAKLFVPWLDDETSRQDMKLTVKQPITVNAHNYTLATSRFVDAAKTDVEVFPMAFVQGVQTKCYNTVAGFELVNTDGSVGIGDGQMSEAHAVIVSGSDDQ